MSKTITCALTEEEQLQEENIALKEIVDGLNRQVKAERQQISIRDHKIAYLSTQIDGIKGVNN